MRDVAWLRGQGSWYQKSDVLEEIPRQAFYVTEVGCVVRHELPDGPEQFARSWETIHLSMGGIR